MNKLKEISFKDRKAIFSKLEQLASQANLSEDERRRLEEDWKNYNDFFSTYDCAKEKGRAEGLKEGLERGLKKGIEEGAPRKNLENAKQMKNLGFSMDDIIQITNLPKEEIEKL